MTNVERIYPAVVGEGYRFDADEVLEAAKGHEFSALMVIGELEGGSFYIAGNCNAGEGVILMRRVEMKLIGAMD